MGKLFEQFLAYYNSASAQQKKADWDELAVYNGLGPSALCMVQDSLYYFKSVEFDVKSGYQNDNSVDSGYTYSLAA